MSEQKYPTLVGSVEFEPETKEVNGKTVTQFTIKLANNTAEPKVRITVWPELAFPPVKKGDYVIVTGKLSVSQAQDGRTFTNLSANGGAVIPGVVKDANPGVAQRPAAAAAEPAF